MYGSNFLNVAIYCLPGYHEFLFIIIISVAVGFLNMSICMVC